MDPYWQRDLWVCVFGSFTTLVAMTLLLPFLPLYVEHLGVQGMIRLGTRRAVFRHHGGQPGRPVAGRRPVDRAYPHGVFPATAGEPEWASGSTCWKPYAMACATSAAPRLPLKASGLLHILWQGFLAKGPGDSQRQAYRLKRLASLASGPKTLCLCQGSHGRHGHRTNGPVARPKPLTVYLLPEMIA